MAQELEARIKEIIQRTHNVKSFRLDIKDNVGFKAGQFLSAKLKTEKELTRYLSISSSPTERGYLEFTKKITESDFSKNLNILKPGDELIIQYPFGKFTLIEGYKRIAFLSGGIGITPIRSICKYAVDEKLDLDIVLIYANRSANDIVFKEDFDAMQKGYPQLKVIHVLSECGSEFKYQGRINSQIIKNEITDYPDRKFYICGPPLMVESMRRILSEELALPGENIVTENFQGY